MIRFVLGVAALVAGWLWSRGARDPLQWPERLPAEIRALREDLSDAVAAGKRAGTAEEERFAARFAQPHIPPG